MWCPDIKITRGGNLFPIEAENGDMYNSIIELSNGAIITGVNTDFSEAKYIGKGGILAEGIYGGICTHLNPKFTDRYIALFDYKYFYDERTLKRETMIEKMFTLPSLIYNPTNGDYTVRYILIHSGGVGSDYSAGCITIWPPHYKLFIDNFQINDKMRVILERDKEWPSPKWYEGK